MATRSILRSYAFVFIVALGSAAHARTWTDSTGKYSIEADLIAFTEDMVILQRPDHELGAVPFDKLSEGDREYLKSKEAVDAAQKSTDNMQTWTLRNGLKVVGRIVDFARKDLTLQRRRGKIYVNDRVFENLPEIYQKMVPQIVNEFEPINPVDKKGVELWLIRQKGGPRTFTLEGVYLELENGDHYGVPFFFFSPEDLAVLRPGWANWLKLHEQEDSYASREQHAFMLQAAAAARAQDQQVQRQIAMMQLNLQAVQAGVTSLWEVTLYPAAAGVGPPLWVVMPGRNSAQATSAALSANPGYNAGPVRRVSY
jgi:hypothetical protein